MKIAIIGAGNLGLAIAKGIIGVPELQEKSLYLTKRNVKALSCWEQFSNVVVTSDNKEAVKKSDIIILTIQPGQLKEVLEEIKGEVTKKHVIISTVTGRMINDIEGVLGSDTSIIRSMPNTAIAVGQSMTCLSGNTKGQQNIKVAVDIFNSLGRTLIIEERMMQAATVICASGIAFWMRLIRATTQGAIQLGFEAAEAKEIAMQTCLGSATLLHVSGNHPEEEIDRVTTPKGCTISGLNEMEHEGLSSALIKGLVKSFDKISEIKK